VGTGTTTTTEIDRVSVIDDHSSPALYRRSDGRLVAFWTDRGTATDDTLYWTISDNADDISSWGSVNSFTATSEVDYAEPVAWNSNLRLYYRMGGPWKYRVSTDSGASFGSEQAFTNFSESRIYIHVWRDGSQLHFALGDHRMTSTGIYHWYQESGDYYTSDGTLIQSASTELTSLSDLTLVYDGTAQGNNPAKQYDLTTDSNGNPVVAFTEHVSTGSGGGDGDYRARWAKWDGSQWVVGAEVTAMGGALPESHYYEGGLSIDRADPTTVYVSVETSNRNYQIQEWTTADNGSTWSKARGVSAGDATLTDPTKRGRPISPRDHDGALPVLWWAGYYDDFTDYLTQVRES
jgi:hypothetical protein